MRCSAMMRADVCTLQDATTRYKTITGTTLYKPLQLATTDYMNKQRPAPARPLWDRITTICAERGWSTVRLESESGVARSTFGKWKTAPRAPTVGTVASVARVLDLDLEEALRLAGVLLPPEKTEDPELTEALAKVAELEAELEGLLARERKPGADAG